MKKIINISGVISSGATTLVHYLSASLKKQYSDHKIIKVCSDSVSDRYMNLVNNFNENRFNEKSSLDLLDYIALDLNRNHKYIVDTIDTYKNVIYVSDRNFSISLLVYVLALVDIGSLSMDQGLDFINSNNLSSQCQPNSLEIHLTCFTKTILVRQYRKSGVYPTLIPLLDEKGKILKLIEALNFYYLFYLKCRKDVLRVSSENILPSRMCNLILMSLFTEK